MASLYPLDFHFNPVDSASFPFPPQPFFGLEEAAAEPLPGPPQLPGGDRQTALDLEQPGDRWFRSLAWREVTHPLGELGARAYALAPSVEGHL